MDVPTYQRCKAHLGTFPATFTAAARTPTQSLQLCSGFLICTCPHYRQGQRRWRNAMFTCLEVPYGLHRQESEKCSQHGALGLLIFISLITTRANTRYARSAALKRQGLSRGQPGQPGRPEAGAVAVQALHLLLHRARTRVSAPHPAWGWGHCCTARNFVFRRLLCSAAGKLGTLTGSKAGWNWSYIGFPGTCYWQNKCSYTCAERRMNTKNGCA